MITKKEVSNTVFGSDAPYGRIITYFTELDSEGTDESAKGILSPKLSWVMKGERKLIRTATGMEVMQYTKGWSNLPEGLRKFEEERAAKAVGINTRLGEAQAIAAKAELDDEIYTLVQKYKAFIKVRGTTLKEMRLLGKECVGRIADLIANSKGVLKDYEESEDGIHSNWVTFSPGDEAVEMSDEGIQIEKAREEEAPEPKSTIVVGRTKKGEPKYALVPKTEAVMSKLEDRNWEHSKTLRKNREELSAWFINRASMTYVLVQNKAISKKQALKRITRLIEVMKEKRDESFEQKLLDSIMPPPYKGYPQFRKRDLYLTAGGRVKDSKEIASMFSEFEQIRRIRHADPKTQKSLQQKARVEADKKFGKSKWYQLYTIFSESRKLTTEQFFEIQANLEDLKAKLTTALESKGKVEKWAFTPKTAPVKEKAEAPKEDTDRLAILGAYVEIEKKLDHYRLFWAEAREAKDREFTFWALQKGLYWKAVMQTFVKTNAITAEEIAAL